MVARGHRSTAGTDTTSVDLPGGTQSIQRAVSVLRILATAREIGLGLTEIAMHAGLTRPTTHRILSILVAEGIVEQRTGTRRYVVGERIPLLALARQTRDPLLDIGLPARSAIIDGELCFPTPSGAPDFYGLSGAMVSGRQHELAVLAFDLLHHCRRRNAANGSNGCMPGRMCRSCIWWGAMTMALDSSRWLTCAKPWMPEQYKLEGIVSKRKAAPYRSGASKDWVKVKTAAWREANRERWRLFERS